jgi:HSP20 family molecular chaperone IbpA
MMAMNTQVCTVGNGNGHGLAERRAQRAVFVPRCDVAEHENEFSIHVELPGVRREGLSIEVDKGVLSLRGEVVEERAKRRGWIAREYGTGDFERRFRIGEGIDTEAIEAELVHGVLILRLPKRDSMKARRIEVREIE